jgi:hypothetical protein
MSIDRPEKAQDGFAEREEGHRFSMPDFTELTQSALE